MEATAEATSQPGSDAPVSRKRRSWAVVAALLLPVGAGQVALGHLGRGALLGVGSVLALLSWRWTGLGAFLLSGLLWIASLVDIVRTRSVGRALRLPTLLLALLSFALTFKVLGSATRYALIKSWKVPSAAMAPTVLPGDRFLSERWSPESRAQLLEALVPQAPLARGDVVVFRPPDRDTSFVMRVIGTAGDTLAVRGGVLHLNGAPVSQRVLGGCEPVSAYVNGEGCELREETLDGRHYHVTRIAEDQGSQFPAGQCPAGMEAVPEGCRVPADHFFVLGDNRGSSLDSRYLGPIPLANLQARAFQLYWSRAPEGEVRWARLGTALD